MPMQEIGKGWEDRSWYNDASACCWLKVPTKKNPDAVLCLWVQPDDKENWEMAEAGRYQLDHIVDSHEGWDGNTCKTLLVTDDLVAVVAAINAVKVEVK